MIRFYMRPNSEGVVGINHGNICGVVQHGKDEDDNPMLKISMNDGNDYWILGHLTEGLNDVPQSQFEVGGAH